MTLGWAEPRSHSSKRAKASGIVAVLLLLLALAVVASGCFSGGGSDRDPPPPGSLQVRWRITALSKSCEEVGVATVLEARRLRVLAFGGSKASIVRRVVSGPIGPQIPATWVCGHPDLELLLDAAAAGELQDLARS